MAGSRSPKAGEWAETPMLILVPIVPPYPPNLESREGPGEEGRRPLAGVGVVVVLGGRWGRGKMLAQSPSYLDGLRAILFPEEGNLLPFLSSPSPPSSLPPWGAQVLPLPEAPKPQPPDPGPEGTRACEPGSGAGQPFRFP